MNKFKHTLNKKSIPQKWSYSLDESGKLTRKSETDDVKHACCPEYNPGKWDEAFWVTLHDHNLWPGFLGSNGNKLKTFPDKINAVADYLQYKRGVNFENFFFILFCTTVGQYPKLPTFLLPSKNFNSTFPIYNIQIFDSDENSFNIIVIYNDGLIYHVVFSYHQFNTE